MARTKQTARLSTQGKGVLKSQAFTKTEQKAKRGDKEAQAKVIQRKKTDQAKRVAYIKKQVAIGRENDKAKKGDISAETKMYRRKKDAARKKSAYIKKRGDLYKGRKPNHVYNEKKLKEQIHTQHEIQKDSKQAKHPQYAMINTKTHEQEQVPVAITNDTLFTEKGPKRLISNGKVETKHYKMFISKCKARDKEGTEKVLDEHD